MSFTDFVEPPWHTPLDVPSAIARIDPSATIAGMYFQAIIEGARGLGATVDVPRERYTRFKFYPQREFADLLVQAAKIFHAGVPLRRALCKLGRSTPGAMLESTMGRVVLGSAEGVVDVLQAMAKSYPLNAPPCTAEVTEAGDNHAIVHLADVGYFLDSHHVGVYEGTLAYAGMRGTVKIRMQSGTTADLLLNW